MHTGIQALLLFLLCTAGEARAQTTFYGRFYDPYYDPCRDRMYGRCYDDYYTVRVVDYPPTEKRPLPVPEQKDSANPFAVRLNKRMEAITATNFVSTNTTPIHIAPGLAPKN